MGYGAAGQITSIGYGTGHTQTRQYNARLQLTRMTVAGVMDVEYTFAATQDNGQIEKMVSGELAASN